MDEPLEETYFRWLCARVKDDPGPQYMELLRILHKTEFVWLVTGDMNRAADALEMRREFSDHVGLDISGEWLEPPCSVLEVLIAFSRRAEFQTGTTAKEWFWQFIVNLGLEEYSRVSGQEARDTVNDILDKFVWRTYRFNGSGGLFPLRRPKHDQRKVEIWYQFSEYLEDHGLLAELL